MILTIDIGNSNIVVIGYSDQGKKLFFKRTETLKKDVLNSYIDYFFELKKEMDVSVINGAILSCVVPLITDEVICAYKKVFVNTIYLMASKDFPKITGHLGNREEIGSDLIATAIAAICDYSLPCIIADAGSATKVTVVNTHGQFLGGVILPGFGMSAKAMNDFIPQLPKVVLEIPKRIITTDTIQSIQGGLYYGLVCGIEGVTLKMERELNTKACHIITGGYAKALSNELSSYTYDADLLNKGLYYAYRMLSNEDRCKQ